MGFGLAKMHHVLSLGRWGAGVKGWAFLSLLLLLPLVAGCGGDRQEDHGDAAASGSGARLQPGEGRQEEGEGVAPDEEEGFSLLSHAMQDSVEEALLGYRSGELKVTGYLFIDPFSEQDVEPCLIFNHGGVDGVSEAVKQRCRWLARQGFLVFAPSYRGEDGGEGEVEVADGEVDDVLAAMRILRHHPGVRDEEFVMIGTSHGALVSVMALERPLGKQLLKGVVAAYGVMDIYRWYQYLVDNGFDVSDPLSVRVYGHGPQDRPRAFARRNAMALVEKLGPAPSCRERGIGSSRPIRPGACSMRFEPPTGGATS